MVFPWLTTPSSTQRATYHFSSLVITAFNRLDIKSSSIASGLADPADIFSQNASICRGSPLLNITPLEPRDAREVAQTVPQMQGGCHQLPSRNIRDGGTSLSMS